jgi:hypothetical protein
MGNCIENNPIIPSPLMGEGQGEGEYRMNHKDWVRKELRELGISLGFRYIPREEIEDRLAMVRNGMKLQEIEALLVVQKMDFYRDHPGWDSLRTF